ncbi:taste receptor type 2 member 7-like [Anomaloglossus baeobatrachus]|uniref:taste receptor type 2 member 7-like n=1 Tax=Anomaloglossus baeobatrachus TaxID=238106 RepID=UPI003F50457B
MSPEKLLILFVSFIIVINGFLINGFIVTANFFWLIKYQTLPTVDVLITGLGLVRLILLTMNMEYVCFSIFHWSAFHTGNPEYIATFGNCMTFCSLWWGSVLSVFYCVKITNYSNRLFMRLKMSISKLVPWMLLISLVISFLFSLPFRWVMFSIKGVNATIYGNINTEVNVVHLFVIIFFGSMIPFTVCCVAICLIIVSLLRHTRNMSSGFNDVQRDIHLSVIWSMVSFLLFYALYFIANIIATFTINIWDTIYGATCAIFITAYPSLHSIPLLFSNRKLKNLFYGVLRCIWKHNRNMSSRNSGNNDAQRDIHISVVRAFFFSVVVCTVFRSSHCDNVIRSLHIMNDTDRAVMVAALLIEAARQEDEAQMHSKRRRHMWAREWLLKRSQFSHMRLAREMQEKNPHDFRNYLPMSEESLKLILESVRPFIQ